MHICHCCFVEFFLFGIFPTFTCQLLKPWYSFFRRFRKSAKIPTRFVISVIPHGKLQCPLNGFSWNLICDYFSIMCGKIQVSVESDKNDGYFTGSSVYICDNKSLNSSLEWEIFWKKIVRNIKKNKIWAIYIYFFFFRNSCRSRDNVVTYCRTEQATDDNTKRPMRFACWLPKATVIHSDT